MPNVDSSKFVAFGSLVLAAIVAGCSPEVVESPTGTGGSTNAGGTGAGDSNVGGTSASAGATSATHIRVHYPVAPGSTMALRGNGGGLSWDKGVPLVAGADDTWSITVSGLEAMLEYRPFFDDTTPSRGPAYRALPGSTTDIYPHFTDTKGTVTLYQAALSSQWLAIARPIWVYVPPTYRENQRSVFPVVYMQDGQNLFDAALSAFGVEWQVDETMDAASELGTIREAIVVGVGYTSDRMEEYTPSYDASVAAGGDANQYLDFLTTELKPLIDRDFRTLPGREVTAIFGASLGGLLACHAGAVEPDVFGLIGAMSPSTWWDNRFIVAEAAALRPSPERPLRVYLDSGASQDGALDTQALRDAYVSVGYISDVTLRYVMDPSGTTSEACWAARLPSALAFLLGPRPDLAPP